MRDSDTTTVSIAKQPRQKRRRCTLHVDPRWHWDLKLLYIVFFTLLGAAPIFLPLALAEIFQLSGSEIGVASALIPLVAACSTPVWAFVVDRTRKPRAAMALATAAGALLFYALFALVERCSFAGACVGCVLFSLFFSCINAILDGVAVRKLGPRDAGLYGNQRLWGACGSAIGCFVTAWTIHFAKTYRSIVPLHALLSAFFLIALAIVAIHDRYFTHVPLPSPSKPTCSCLNTPSCHCEATMKPTTIVDFTSNKTSNPNPITSTTTGLIDTDPKSATHPPYLVLSSAELPCTEIDSQFPNNKDQVEFNESVSLIASNNNEATHPTCQPRFFTKTGSIPNHIEDSKDNIEIDFSNSYEKPSEPLRTNCGSINNSNDKNDDTVLWSAMADAGVPITQLVSAAANATTATTTISTSDASPPTTNICDGELRSTSASHIYTQIVDYIVPATIEHGTISDSSPTHISTHTSQGHEGNTVSSLPSDTNTTTIDNNFAKTSTVTITASSRQSYSSTSAVNNNNLLSNTNAEPREDSNKERVQLSLLAENESDKKPTHEDFKVLRNPYGNLLNRGTIVFLICASLWGATTQLIASFLFVYLTDHRGITTPLLSILVLFDILPELPLFMLNTEVLSYLGMYKSFLISAILVAARLIGYMFVPNGKLLWCILPIELMHGLAFSLYWTAALRYITMITPNGYEVTYQGVFSGCYIGVGGVIGSLCGGVLYRHYGGRTMFMFGAILIAVAIIILTLLGPKFPNVSHLAAEKRKDKEARKLARRQMQQQSV